MNDFQPVYPELLNSDPYKRVHYVKGLVLGVDEFVQEELYQLEKHQMHNRTLHGYGTACGLDLSIKNDSEGWKVVVGPGIALNPAGQEIRVDEAQCALLNIWLHNHRQDVLDRLGSPAITTPPVPLSLYLVLCYRQCETDHVSIPSGPCHSLDKTSVASRIADDFTIALQFEPPTQIEDVKIRLLIDLLRQIEIKDVSGGLSLDDIKQLVLSVKDENFPPVFSPPLGAMHMRPNEAELFIRTALRVWVTAVRPELLSSGRNCASGPPHEDCVLLARLDFEIEDTEAGFRVDGDLRLDEDARPYLLQTRLLQEYLSTCCAGESGPAIFPSPSPGSIDESNLVHLTGDEAIFDKKTFHDPIALAANGRLQKRIILAPATGMPIDEKVDFDFFRAGVPALRFEFEGEAAFSIPIPDDIEYSIAPQVRLLWGIKGATTTVTYTWQVRNRFAEPGKTFGPFTGNTVSGNETNAKAGKIYLSDYINLNDKVHEDDVFGVLRVKLNALTPVDIEIYLLNVEIMYVANRLGRLLP